MSSLYIYDFGDEQYIVDDSGERWEHIQLQPENSVVCESCFTEIKTVHPNHVNEVFINEHGTYLCPDCHDIEVIDLSTIGDVILMDSGMGQYEVRPGPSFEAVDIYQQMGDGHVILREEGELSAWREITLGGTIYGYAYEGEVDDPADVKIDTHSVNCYCCGKLTDERETYPLTEAGGEICPQCTEAIEQERKNTYQNLGEYTTEYTQDDVITDLACRLVQLATEFGLISAGG